MNRASRPAGKRLAEVFGGEPLLAGWMERARRDARVAAVIARRLPSGLGRSFRVLALEDGELLLGATNGAAAIALRREAPALLAALRAEGVTAASMRAVVVPRSAPPHIVHTASRRGIAADGIAALEALAGRLPEGPLRVAVERLAERCGERAEGEA